ncbi:MAG: hypothetical protein ACYC47_02730 [Desulfobacteria bacterium]|nr:hypothetical protein [Deltaproteobacteria bacterium]MDA8180575.1 hypothetical protein [Deltaproteobacteria bacterium]HQT98160.1 hypothetical protein [Thermodesulfobacteriota bacterium]
MPWPPNDMFVMLAKMNFIAKGIKLPVDWEDLTDKITDPEDKTGRDMYPEAFKPAERTVPPNSPMNLFREATSNKYHVATAKEIGEQYEKFIEGVCGAISTGIGQWMSAATVVAVNIVGPVGILHPGCVVGPPLTPLILSSAPKATPMELKYSMAVANTIGTMWLPWHIGLTGILSYPAFAAFPGPFAPPMPNIPMPLVAFASPGEAGLSPSTLKSLMDANLADPTALHASDLFDAISKAFGTVFQIFKVSTLVTNVLGTGPVPTFAPPFVPVGPVLGGIGTGPPGSIS